LGENPDDFDRLLESLNGIWKPQSDYEQCEVVPEIAAPT